jgi:hypothetical protein
VRARIIRAGVAVLVVAALVASGIAANLVLLRYADSTNDPAGRLTPRADIQLRPASIRAGTLTGGRPDGHAEERDD